jgi:hypothetical protein
LSLNYIILNLIRGKSLINLLNLRDLKDIRGSSKKNQNKMDIRGLNSRNNIDGDAVISGDLLVSGTTTTIETESLVVEDPMVKLGLDNPANLADSGFITEYTSSGKKYTGLIRDKSDNNAYKLVDALTSEPDASVNNTATYDANLAPLEISSLDSIGNLQIGPVGATGVSIGRTAGVVSIDGPVTFNEDIQCVNSIFWQTPPTDLETYPYNIVPRIRRFKLSGLVATGTVDTQLATGIGQAMALHGSSKGGVYLISLMEENSDYGLNPIWSGLWYVEVSNFATGKIRLLTTIYSSNITGSVVSPKSFRIENTHPTDTTGNLILSQVQMG